MKIIDTNESIFVPYRICPLGAHIDHQLGNVTGFAIDKGITMNYHKTLDGSFHVSSYDFENEAIFTYSTLPKIMNTWYDYLVASILSLKEKYELKYGIYGYINQALPIGGLASSSTIIILYLLSLAKVNNIMLTKEELVSLVVKVESKYLNKKVGILDPFCEIYGKKDKLLYIDTKDSSYHYIETNQELNFKICLIYSGVSRNLRNTLYNVRVDECKVAAYLINSFDRENLIEFSKAYLRDFSKIEFEKVKQNFPKNIEKRCTHFYSEMDRVQQGISYFKQGNLEEFGRLMFLSGSSSIYNYETGSKPLETLHNILRKTDGVYGGRFSGAGFNGYYIAIIDPSKEKQIKKFITAEYLKTYPEYKSKFKIMFCNTSDGVKL